MKIIPLITFASASLILVGCGGDKSAESSSETSNSSTSSPAPSSSGGMALKTEIPDEMIEGTPQPIKVDVALEPAPKSAPSLMVAEGTVLLSGGKSVTGSDDFPIIGDLTYVTDGDKEGGEGFFVELMDGPQWVQIDLGAPAKLSAIWVWHYHSQLRAYHDVIVQVSNDPEFKTGVTTLFNNDYDNSAEQGKGSDKPYVDTRFGKLVDAEGIEAQYVRLWSNGNTANDMNHYIEVEVFGVPAS